MSDIDVRVKAIIGEALARQPHTIGDRDTAEALGLDSLAFFDVVVDVQDEFGLDLGDDDLDGLADVGALVALVATKAGRFVRRER